MFLKKLFIIFIPFCAIATSSFSQSDWHYLPSVDAEANRYDDVYFSDSLHGWACGPETVIRSTDAGVSWDTVATNLGYGRTIEFLNNNVGFLGVLSGNKFYKTSNGGLTWIDISPLLASPSGYSGICGLAHFGDTVVAVGSWSFEAYIHISYDQGNSWSFIHLDSLAENLVDVHMFSGTHFLVSGRSNDSIGDATVLETTDAGQSWRSVFRSYRPMQIAWKLQYVNAHLMVVSMQNRSGLDDSSFIAKSYDNGRNWEIKMVVPFDIDMEGIGFLDDSIGFCGGWSHGMRKTEDGGNSWHFYNIGANINRFFVLSPTLAYASGQSIYKYFKKINTSFNDVYPSVHHKPNFIKNIFPNPIDANHMLSIEYFIQDPTNVRLDLHTMNGRHIQTLVNEHQSAGLRVFYLDTSGLADGAYLISLGTDANSHAQKFIVKN